MEKIQFYQRFERRFPYESAEPVLPGCAVFWQDGEAASGPDARNASGQDGETASGPGARNASEQDGEAARGPGARNASGQ